MTFGGEYAEACFSFDGMRLIFQSTRDDLECDQIFTIAIDGSGLRMVSNGGGKTACAYFLPGDESIIYSSTHHEGKACPPRPDDSHSYVWPIDPNDIYKRVGRRKRPPTPLRKRWLPRRGARFACESFHHDVSYGLGGVPWPK